MKLRAARAEIDSSGCARVHDLRGSRPSDDASARHAAEADEGAAVLDLAHVAHAVLIDEALQHLELADRVARPDDEAAEDVLRLLSMRSCVRYDTRLR